MEEPGACLDGRGSGFGDRINLANHLNHEGTKRMKEKQFIQKIAATLLEDIQYRAVQDGIFMIFVFFVVSGVFK